MTRSWNRGRWWYRTGKQDPLGTGVWRRAEQRFRRAVDRYHQVLERLEPVAVEAGRVAEGQGGHSDGRGQHGDNRGEQGDSGGQEGAVIGALGMLRSTGADLVALLRRVHDVSVSAQVLGPSSGEDVPPGPDALLLDVHRALARSATLVAQAAESVTMVLVAIEQTRPTEAAAAAGAARRAAAQAAVNVSRAESILSASVSVTDSDRELS
jgi:hypothetical protein